MEMLPFNELSEHVRYISEKMGEKKLFGNTTIDKTVAIYRLAKQKLTITKDEIIMHVKIPLMGESFDCEHLTPVTHETGELQLDSEYILTNNKSRIYYGMTKTEREKCITIENADICTITSAIHKVTDDNLCEFNVRSESYKNCKVQPATNLEKWIKLRDNVWIFSFPKKTETNITCGNEIETVWLKGAGKIQINGECSVETKNNRIEEHVFTVSKVNTTKNWRTIEFKLTAEASLGLSELNESVKKMGNDLKTYRLMNVCSILTALAMLTLYYGVAMGIMHMMCCRFPRN